MKHSKKFSVLTQGIAVLGVLGLVGSTSQAQAQTGAKPAGYVPQEVLVKFRSGPFSQMAQAINKHFGGRALETFGYTGWQRVKLPAGANVAAAISQYRSFVDVENVEPNYVWKAYKIPNDPRYSSQWAWSKIGAPLAWDRSTGSSSVVVAVIDTGVDYTHPDLNANMWRNPGEVAGNGVDDDSNGYVDDVYGIDRYNYDSDPMDDDDHGTHVAGTIGASSNNGVGVAGTNWNVKIMALKFLGPDGGSTSDAITCFEYVTRMKQRGVNVRVTNNSWGGTGYSAALKSAMDTASANGVIHLTAAGNEGFNNDTTPSYPCNYDSPGIISVAASDSSDNKPTFSNYGATTVDLTAPGVSILSTVRNGGYAYFSGTSMATPHVAGAAALLTDINPSLTVAQLRSLLLSNVDVLSLWSGKVVTSGRLNLNRAAAAAAGTVAPTPIVTPTPTPTPVVTPTPTPTPIVTPTPTPTPSPTPTVITARGETFNMVVGARSLSIAAPGVLLNDTGGRALLKARIVKQPTRGSVTLQANGAFVFKLYSQYSPGVGKTDYFSYKVTDGYTTSIAVNATINWVSGTLSQSSDTSYAQSVRTSSPQPAYSGESVTQSSASARSAKVVLQWNTKLNSTQVRNADHFVVTINGEDIIVESASFDEVTQSLTLNLPKNTVQPGDEIQVQWDGLQNTAQIPVPNGTTQIIAR
jgi:subtilisin family serine protease